jgi:hypothetical protein
MSDRRVQSRNTAPWIFVAIYRGVDSYIPRVFSEQKSDLYDWMDNMQYRYEDFAIEKVEAAA